MAFLRRPVRSRACPAPARRTLGGLVIGPLIGLAAALLAGLAAGCAAGGGAPDLPVVEVPCLEERALLLLLADRRVYEPFTVEKSLAGPPDLRREVALTLGRIGDARGAPVLRGLLLDDAPAVRRAAVFALGELAEGRGEGAALPEVTADLLRTAGEGDRAAAVLAVEALGKIARGSRAEGDELRKVLAALTPLPENERWARLLPHLYRFPDDSVVPLAERALATVDDPALAAGAALALTANGENGAPRGDALPVLRILLADPNPLSRARVARALGAIGLPDDVAALADLLDDAEEAPVVAALEAAARAVGERRLEVPAAAFRAAVAGLLTDPRPGVRRAALESAAVWLPDEALEARLAAVRESGAPWERALALAASSDAALAKQGAESDEALLRAAAARAAAAAGDAATLDRLLTDADPGVRAAAWRALPALGIGDAALGERLAAGLADPDPGVRAAVLLTLAERPVLPLETLEKAFAAARADRVPSARIAAVGALTARGEAEALERGGVVLALERLAEASPDGELRGAGNLGAGDPALRRALVEALRALGRPEPPATATRPVRGGEVYRQIVQRTRRPRTVEIRTSRGPIRVRLACPDAPLTCLNFLQLAAQGFYDGLPLTREPGRWVEGGDPDRFASGLDLGPAGGGPGYQLRDEVTPLRLERGVLAMDLDRTPPPFESPTGGWPDTAGSRFLLTLTPQPLLDGRLTAFGEVTAGLDILDRIEPGDVIEAVVEVR